MLWASSSWTSVYFAAHGLFAHDIVAHPHHHRSCLGSHRSYLDSRPRVFDLISGGGSVVRPAPSFNPASLRPGRIKKGTRRKTSVSSFTWSSLAGASPEEGSSRNKNNSKPKLFNTVQSTENSTSNYSKNYWISLLRIYVALYWTIYIYTKYWTIRLLLLSK